MSACSLGGEVYVTGRSLSHSFQSRVAGEFKEPEARSQKTQAPVLVLQLTTKCTHFISHEPLTGKVKVTSLLLHGAVLMTTNVTAGKAQKGSVGRITERNPM